MRLWPFPKKEETAFSEPTCDLPEGVMLAAPEDSHIMDLPVPSYAKPEPEHDPIDPATAIPSEAVPSAFVPSSRNNDMDAEFNKLFEDNAPALFLAPSSPEVPVLQSPLNMGDGLATTESPFTTPPEASAATPAEALFAEIAEPAQIPAPPVKFTELEAPIAADANIIQQDALSELLEQLSKTSRPAPKPIDLSGFEQEPLAPPPVETAEPSSLMENWNLDPTEAPPLSSDWSLVSPGQSSPAPVAESHKTYSPADLQPEIQASAPADTTQPESIQEAFAHRASELTGSLNAAFYAEIGQQFDPEMPGSVQSSIFPRAKTGHPTETPADELVPPPHSSLLDNSALLTSPPHPTTAQHLIEDSLGFPDVPTWEAQPDAQEMNPAADDFAALPASMEGWGTDIQPVSLDGSLGELSPLEALAPPSITAAESAFSLDALGSLEALNDVNSPTPIQNAQSLEPSQSLPSAPYQETMATSPNALEINEAEESWSEDDYIPESAELNSSHTAYDMNHYDDPDEPAEAIELEALPDDISSAMADMLSQLKPQPATAPAEAIEAKARFDSSLFDDEEDAEPLANQAPKLSAETPANPEPQNAHAEKTHSESGCSMNHTNAGENEDMLNLKGLKAGPEQSLMEALSAKFIARPKGDDSSTPTASTEEQPPQAAAQPAAEESLMDPTGLLHELPVSKIKPPTLSQAMSSFEEEMLLNETRFIRQSINNLVDGYFARRERDSSC